MSASEGDSGPQQISPQEKYKKEIQKDSDWYGSMSLLLASTGAIAVGSSKLLFSLPETTQDIKVAELLASYGWPALAVGGLEAIIFLRKLSELESLD